MEQVLGTDRASLGLQFHTSIETAKVAAMRERVALMDPEAIPSTRASGFGFERIPVEFGAVLRSVIHANGSQDLERRERELAALRLAAKGCVWRPLKR